jgi:hypothetical protein
MSVLDSRGGWCAEKGKAGAKATACQTWTGRQPERMNLRPSTCKRSHNEPSVGRPRPCGGALRPTQTHAAAVRREVHPDRGQPDQALARRSSVPPIFRRWRKIHSRLAATDQHHAQSCDGCLACEPARSAALRFLPLSLLSDDGRAQRGREPAELREHLHWRSSSFNSTTGGPSRCRGRTINAARLTAGASFLRTRKVSHSWAIFLGQCY